MNERPGLIMFIMFLVLMLMFGAAYYLGQQEQGAQTSSAGQKPVKKFRAKPGTERKNVRALTSSQPSEKEETSDKPIDIWGDLDGDGYPEIALANSGGVNRFFRNVPARY